MHKVTIDTNCLIDVAELREDDTTYSYKDTLAIVNKHQKDLNVAVVAASGSEIRIAGNKVENIEDFFVWLDTLGMKDLDVLKPIFYWGISFWNWAIYADDKGSQLDSNLQALLFPALPKENPEDPENYKWRNAKHDVLIAWAHIWNAGNVFITRDRNFLDKKDELIALGAGNVMHPREFINTY